MKDGTKLVLTIGEKEIPVTANPIQLDSDIIETTTGKESKEVLDAIAYDEKKADLYRLKKNKSC